MPDSNRSGPSEVGLRDFLIAAAITMFAAMIGLGFIQQAKYEDAAAEHTREYAKYAEQKIGEACRGIASVEQARCFSDARIKSELEKRDNQHDQADLVAQQRSALWTTIMGIAAVIGMALSVVGVYLVWSTFRETRRSAKAAEDQLALARTITAAELRPHLFVDRVEMERSGEDIFTPLVYFRNYGKMPARRIEVRTDCYVSRPNDPLLPNVLKAIPVGIPVCAPGKDRFLGDIVVLNDDELKGFMNGSLEIVLRVRFRYTGARLRPLYAEKADFLYNYVSLDTGKFYITLPAERTGHEQYERDLVERMEKKMGKRE